MKYFLTFALCAVVTTVLVHLIVKLLGFDESSDVTLWISIAFLYFVFYGLSNPFTKTQNKED